jgi:hypothetical protein
MQFIGHTLPAFSMTLNREETSDYLERSIRQDREIFPSTDNFIERLSWLNSFKNSEIVLLQSLSKNCFESLSCQYQKVEEISTSVFKLDLIESLKAFKLTSNNSDSLGIGYVPILARAEFGDIYKDVYDYELNLDRNPDINVLVSFASTESLSFFISPKKNFSYRAKTTSLNSFKTATALKYNSKYNSAEGIKILNKEKKTKAIGKISSFKILPSNYSSLKFKIDNYSSKPNTGKLKNSIASKSFPKSKVAYSLVDRIQSQEPLWQQQIERKLASKRQQLADRQRQFRIKIEQNIEQSYREQQRQQETLTERKTQELRQDLLEQQQQQSQPIRNYY